MNQATAVTTAAGMSEGARKDLQRLRGAIGQVVGSVFYGTLLRASRNSGLKGAFGHGGRGEEVFSAQLHGIFAERMGMATRNSLQETLFRTLARQQRLISEARSTAFDNFDDALSRGL